jgi:hypothetical protein
VEVKLFRRRTKDLLSSGSRGKKGRLHKPFRSSEPVRERLGAFHKETPCQETSRVPERLLIFT